jgi:hypothetical protein
MLNPDEAALYKLLRDSLLDGQDGIKIRAFLAFNRDNKLAKIENLENLQSKGAISIKEDMLYPIDTL